MGRGNSALTQTQKHLYHPSPLQPQRRYLQMRRAECGCVCSWLQSSQNQPLPSWPSISKTEVTSRILGKASQTGFVRTTTKRRLNFHLVFLCHKKDDTGVPNKLENFHSKKEPIICHKPQTGTLLLNFQLKVNAGHRCFPQQSYTCTDFQKQNISRITV